MNGQAHWIDIAFLLVGVAGVAALFLSDKWVGRSLRTEDRNHDCPRHGKAELVIVRNINSGRLIGVRRCTAFKDPDSVTCDRDCVFALNEAEARLATSANLVTKAAT